MIKMEYKQAEQHIYTDIFNNSSVIQQQQCRVRNAATYCSTLNVKFI